MEKVKIWKILLIVAIIVLLIFIIVTLRKTLIITSLQNKISEYKNSQNFYFKENFDENSKISTIEQYKKDDITKIIIKMKQNDITIIQFEQENEIKRYVKKDGNVSLNDSYNTNNINKGNIVNFVNTSNILQTIYDSIVSTIKKEKINGVEYYSIKSLYNSNFIYNENTKYMKALIEKDTGLAIKYIETINENGEEKDYVTHFEYKFNCVTEDDIKEPDII